MVLLHAEEVEYIVLRIVKAMQENKFQIFLNFSSLCIDKETFIKCASIVCGACISEWKNVY